MQMMPVDCPPISGWVKFSTIIRQLMNLARCTVAGIGQGHGIVGMDERAIFEDRMGDVRASISPSRRQDRRRVAHPIEREEVAAPKHARLVRSHRGIATPPPKARPVPTQSSTITVNPSPLLSVRSKKNPPSPPATYRLRNIQRSQMMLEKVSWLLPCGQCLSERANRAPPVPALEALLRVAAIDQHPALGTRAEAAVEVADQRVVGTGRALWAGARFASTYVSGRTMIWCPPWSSGTASSAAWIV